jgi:hypothetical protein
VEFEGRLIDYLQRRRRNDDGKALLIGWRGDLAAFSLAAGLRGVSDHPRFLTFGRYLIHQRFGCDGFALLLPAVLDDSPCYVAEWRCCGDSGLITILADGCQCPSPASAPLIGDLGVREPALPGLLRRELDALYEALKRPVPGARD